MKSKAAIIKDFKSRKSITDSGLSLQRENSNLSDAFYDGDYMTYRGVSDNKVAVPTGGVQFNKVQPYVNAVSGFMIQTRRDAKYYPRVSDPEVRKSYSKTANSLKDYVLDNARADQVESQQDTLMLIRGVAAVETAMTYGEGYATTDPNGEVIMDDVSNDVGYDPMARKKNLLDARWAYYRKSYSLEEAKVLFDDSDEEDFDDSPDGINNTGYKFDPTLGQPYDRSRVMETAYDWNSRDGKTVWVYFYQWSETEKFYRADNPVYKLTNPIAIQQAMIVMDQIEAEAKADDSMFRFDATAERLTFDAATKKKLEDAFESLIEVFPYNRKVFYTAVLSGNKCFTAYRSLCQQGFTIKFKTGIWNNTKKIWVGMVNAMMEPAKYYNKGLTQLMYMIATNSKGGWFWEEGASDNIRDFEANVNRTDAVVKLNEGGLLKIKSKKEPFAPAGYDAIIQLADTAVGDSSGIDKNFIMQQSGQGNMTAMLHRQIMKQVTSTLAPYFDAREAYQEEHRRLLLDFLRIYAENNVGLSIRIAGEEGYEEFLTISEDPFNAEYDVKIEEAPESDEEAAEQVTTLTMMGDKLLTVNDPAGKGFYALAVKKMKLDDEDKQEILALLQPAEDPRIIALQQENEMLKSRSAQMQEARISAETDLIKANIDKTMSSVQKDAADITKKLSEIEQIDIENLAALRVTPDKVSVSI